jgi:hypothetical protein
MKTNLRCWTAFLAAAVAISCFAGCKPNEPVDDTTPPASNSVDSAPLPRHEKFLVKIRYDGAQSG